jgi:hypothetical protein
MEEGMTLAQARARVARAAGVNLPSLKKWSQHLADDNAPLRIMPQEGQRQRLRFRFDACLKFARRKGLSGEQMLAMFDAEPEGVRYFSLRLPMPPVKSAAAREQSFAGKR